MKSSVFSRRALMKGVGAGLFAPLMREVLAGTATPGRLVVVMECNGLYPEAFLSAAARTAVGAAAIGTRHNFQDAYPASALSLTGDALSTATCLSPLAATDGQISLENRAAVVLGLSSSVTGGGHTCGTAGLSSAPDGASVTIDAALAPRLKATAPFDAIRLGTSAAPNPISYQSCNFGRGKPAPIIVNPSLAYEAVFGSVSGTSQAGKERGRLFDFARADAQKALATFSGNSNERLKVERYLTSLENLRAREDQLAAMAGRVKPFLPVAPGSNPLLMGDGLYIESLDTLEAQFQIATASLLGGLTNVVVLVSGTANFDMRYDSIMPGVGRHDMQHGIEANWLPITAVTRRHVKLAADLARTLAATPEMNASGSMLDHTAILYLSDNGEQHHSGAVEWPMLLLGGNALGLKTDGRTVIYPGAGAAKNRQASNLFNSLGHAFGDSTFDTFGLEGAARIAPGPLGELYG